MPTAAISHIDVTRPRKPERSGGNLAAGAAIGLAAGLLWYRREIADIKAQAEMCSGCYHLDIAAGYAMLTIPIGVVGGIAGGAIVNTPPPHDRYYPFVEPDGRVWFREVER